MGYKKVDLNQKAIVSELEKLGCSVVSLASVGKGCPDIAVAMIGKTFLIEIKNSDRYWKMEPLQIKFLIAWKADVPIIESVEDARAFVTAVRTDKYAEWVRNKIHEPF